MEAEQDNHESRNETRKPKRKYSINHNEPIISVNRVLQFAYTRNQTWCVWYTNCRLYTSRLVLSRKKKKEKKNGEKIKLLLKIYRFRLQELDQAQKQSQV